MVLAIFLLGSTAWLSVVHKAANTLSFDLEFFPSRCFFVTSGLLSLDASFRFNLRASIVPSTSSEVSGCFLGGGL